MNDYYVVFSNVHGSTTSNVIIDVKFSYIISIFVYLLIAVSILVVIGVIYEILKKQKTESLSSSTAAQKKEALSPTSEKIFCIRCGSENLGTAKFCKVCGATIE